MYKMKEQTLMRKSSPVIFSIMILTFQTNLSQAQTANNSPQTAYDASETSVNSRQRLNDANLLFLDNQAKNGVQTSLAGKLKRPDALVPQGTIIQGVLETAIQSDLPGVVRGIVAQDVWSLDGRRVLIPQGSRLIGDYRSGIATGQTRVLIAWNRVLTSDGISVQLGSLGTDTLGRSGMTGKVDKHNVERFGSAILLTVLGGVSQYLATLGQAPQAPETTVTSIDPITGAITTTTTQGTSNQNQARQIGAQSASQSLSQIANQALQDSVNIPPTIHIDQGVRMIVMVRQDLDFSELYLDPVIEEYNRLKHPDHNVYK